MNTPMTVTLKRAEEKGGCDNFYDNSYQNVVEECPYFRVIAQRCIIATGGKKQRPSLVSRDACKVVELAIKDSSGRNIAASNVKVSLHLGYPWFLYKKAINSTSGLADRKRSQDRSAQQC